MRCPDVRRLLDDYRARFGRLPFDVPADVDKSPVSLSVAAVALGVHPGTVRNKIKQGKLEGLYIDGWPLMVSAESLKKYIEENPQKEKDDTADWNYKLHLTQRDY
jgi:hypothetical protein